MKRLGRRRLARQDRRGRVLDAARHQQRLAANDADLGLAVFISPQPGDIGDDDHVIAAARLQCNLYLQKYLQSDLPH